MTDAKDPEKDATPSPPDDDGQVERGEYCEWLADATTELLSQVLGEGRQLAQLIVVVVALEVNALVRLAEAGNAWQLLPVLILGGTIYLQLKLLTGLVEKTFGRGPVKPPARPLYQIARSEKIRKANITTLGKARTLDLVYDEREGLRSRARMELESASNEIRETGKKFRRSLAVGLGLAFLAMLATAKPVSDALAMGALVLSRHLLGS